MSKSGRVCCKLQLYCLDSIAVSQYTRYSHVFGWISPPTYIKLFLEMFFLHPLYFAAAEKEFSSSSSLLSIAQMAGRPDHGELDGGDHLPGQSQPRLQPRQVHCLICHHGEVGNYLQILQGFRMQAFCKNCLNLLKAQCAVIQLGLRKKEKTVLIVGSRHLPHTKITCSSLMTNLANKFGGREDMLLKERFNFFSRQRPFARVLWILLICWSNPSSWSPDMKVLSRFTYKVTLSIRWMWGEVDDKNWN